MAIVITRLYDEKKYAEAVADRFAFNRFPLRAVRTASASPGEDKTALGARLTNLGVHESAVDHYAEHLAQGKTALIVHATHKPLGAARIARDIVARSPALDSDGLTEEHFVKDTPGVLSILEDHPRFLTSRTEIRGMRSAGPVSRGLGPKLLIKNRKAKSAISGGRFMSRMFWPMPLLRRNRKASSAISGGKYISRAFWPMALISRKKRGASVIRGGRLMLTTPSDVS